MPIFNGPSANSGGLADCRSLMTNVFIILMTIVIVFGLICGVLVALATEALRWKNRR
jgi:hypothetical protein